MTHPRISIASVKDFKLRFVVQRVQNLTLHADQSFRGSFERGLLVYLGVGGKVMQAEAVDTHSVAGPPPLPAARNTPLADATRTGGEDQKTKHKQPAGRQSVHDDELHSLIKLSAEKILRLRTFSQNYREPNMNLSLLDLSEAGQAGPGVGLALVSQFTLFADLTKGNRPSFSSALPGSQAKHVYELATAVFSEVFAGCLVTGIFGADMKIHYMNDGPVTYLFDASGGRIVSF